MYIFEVIHETESGTVDHTVLTANNKEDAIEAANVSESQVVNVESYGTYRRHDIYTAIREEIFSRGVSQPHV